MHADVIVVGGGIIGCAATYYLSKRGKKVVQLERGYFSAGASGACDQMVIPQSKAPNEHLTLALYSVSLYKALSKELDADIEYVQKGALILIENQEELAIMEGIAEQQRARGLDVEIISPAEATRMQPGLNTDAFLATSYSREDGEVNPFRTSLAFVRAAVRLGAAVHPYTEVERLLVEHGAVAGVRTTVGDFRAPVVVNAAGAWSPLLGKIAGLDIPIKPRRGQIVITEAVAPVVHRCVLNARYIVGKHNPAAIKGDSMAAKLGVGISLTQSHKGNVLFGSTREFVGYDTANSFEGLGEVLSNALRLVPALGELNVIRTMGGVRPYTPDSKPLIGYVDGLPGCFLATGHEGDGICLAPATGKLVADLIVDGASDVPAAAAFDPNRFPLYTSSPAV